MRFQRSPAPAFLLVGLALSSTARGSVVSTMPVDAEVGAPNDVQYEAETTVNEHLVFEERQCFDLSADLDVGAEQSIAAGTRVSCTMIHRDEVLRDADNIYYLPPIAKVTVSVMFDEQILAVLDDKTTLDDSDDECGLASVDYPSSADGNQRGLEAPYVWQNWLGATILHEDEALIVSQYIVDVTTDGLTKISSNYDDGFDQVRVITACPP
ncbi:MAG: hypothetical protein KTR31_01050 [Myxococcales bacterium]|nr:hypothetical protein [Myxococcales bacterium]